MNDNNEEKLEPTEESVRDSESWVESAQEAGLDVEAV